MSGGDPRFPEEVLNLIVQSLDPQCIQDLRALAQISQASKQLHRLAEPLLYQSYPGQRHANPLLWLRAVLAKPGRTQLVRHITVHEFVRWRADDNESDETDIAYGEHTLGNDDTASWSSDEWSAESEDMEILTPREIALSSYSGDFGRLDEESLPMLQELIEAAKMKPRNRSMLITAFQASAERNGSTSVDLIMSLIVLACPSLSTLTIWICDGFESALLPIALTARSGPITELNVHREGEQDTRARVGAVGWLSWHNVYGRRNVKCLAATNDILDHMEPCGPWASMKSMRLNGCTLRPWTFQNFVGGTPSLTSLELRSTIGKQRVRSRTTEDVRLYEPCHVDSFGDVLREHGSGLKRLVIDDGGMFGQSSPLVDSSLQRYPLCGIGILQQLTSLEELEVTPWMILGIGSLASHFVDLLPETLRTLRILDCHTAKLAVDIRKEIGLLKRNPAFASLKICVPGSKAFS